MKKELEVSDIKQRIIEESIKLFVKYGAKSITVNDIAAGCGISKRTLYENFADKELLLSTCVKVMNAQSRVNSTILEKNSTDVLDFLIKTILLIGDASQQISPSFYRELKKFYPKIAVEFSEFQEEITIPQTILILEKGKQEGWILQNTSSELAIRLLLGQVHSLIYSDIAEKVKTPINKLLQIVILQFARGIATDKGLKRLSSLEIETL